MYRSSSINFFSHSYYSFFLFWQFYLLWSQSVCYQGPLWHPVKSLKAAPSWHMLCITVPVDGLFASGFADWKDVGASIPLEAGYWQTFSSEFILVYFRERSFSMFWDCNVLQAFFVLLGVHQLWTYTNWLWTKTFLSIPITNLRVFFFAGIHPNTKHDAYWMHTVFQMS